jgi:hypothetical protein
MPSSPSITPRQKALRDLRMRYRLRTLMVLLAVACVPLAIWTHRSREQRRVVTQIRKNGGWVRYDFQRDVRGQPAESHIPKVLLSRLGEDYFHEVREVETHSAADMAELSRLRNIDCLHINVPTLTDADFLPVALLRKLKGIDIYGNVTDPNTRISDRSMELLARLPALEGVNVESSLITAEGLAKLAGSTSLRWLNVSSPDKSIEEAAADPLREHVLHCTVRHTVPGAFGQSVARWSGKRPPGPRPVVSSP